MRDRSVSGDEEDPRSVRRYAGAPAEVAGPLDKDLVEGAQRREKLALMR